MASLRAEGAAEAPDLGPSFGPAETLDVRHVQRLDVDGLLGLASSWSYLALRPDRDEVMTRIRGARPDRPGDRHRGRGGARRSTSRTWRAPTAPPP